MNKNQYDSGDILFLSPAGGPITELRQTYQDELALYTEDNQLLQDLREWKQLKMYVRYFKGGRTIAVDMIFPHAALKDLLKKLHTAKTALPAAGCAAAAAIPK